MGREQKVKQQRGAATRLRPQQRAAETRRRRIFREAVCDKCLETFVPLDAGDLEHVQDSRGNDCGGQACEGSYTEWEAI